MSYFPTRWREKLIYFIKFIEKIDIIVTKYTPKNDRKNKQKKRERKKPTFVVHQIHRGTLQLYTCNSLLIIKYSDWIGRPGFYFYLFILFSFSLDEITHNATMKMRPLPASSGIDVNSCPGELVGVWDSGGFFVCFVVSEIRSIWNGKLSVQQNGR